LGRIDRASKTIGMNQMTVSDNGRRALAVYVDNKGYLIHQAKALWASLLHIECADTDLLCFGPEKVLNQLPDHPRLIKQIQPPHRLSHAYGYINSIACLAEPEAAILGNYAMVLKTDVDTFLTPNWHRYKPNGFRFGRGQYVHDEMTRESIRELANIFGCTHRGVHNIGSTFAGKADDVIRVCKLGTRLTEYLLEVSFAQHHGKWPGWFRGVASMYATEVAINHFFHDASSRFDLLDQASDSQAGVNSFPHIHCWFTKGDYSKHKWIDGVYKGRTEQELDLTVVGDYCLAMAIRAQSL